MERQLTVACSPQQNGVADRKNRTICEMGRSMLIEKGMPVIFWAEAVYIQNRCYTTSEATAEAEYVSASEATAQAIWFRFVLDDFGEMRAEVTLLFYDNMSAISMAKNPVFHQRTRHINRKYHFIREALQERVINVKSAEVKNNLQTSSQRHYPKTDSRN